MSIARCTRLRPPDERSGRTKLHWDKRAKTRLRHGSPKSPRNMVCTTDHTWRPQGHPSCYHNRAELCPIIVSHIPMRREAAQDPYEPQAHNFAQTLHYAVLSPQPLWPVLRTCERHPGRGRPGSYRQRLPQLRANGTYSTTVRRLLPGRSASALSASLCDR